MTPEKAMDIARLVLKGQSRSYVDAARLLAEYVVKIGESSPVASMQPTPSSELFPLAVRIEKGRQKYPNGATVLSLFDEVGEVAHAVNKYEPAERVREELLDVAVVAMRLYLGEIDRSLEMDGFEQKRKVLPCPRCGGDEKIRCVDADCLTCLTGGYCDDATPCPHLEGAA